MIAHAARERSKKESSNKPKMMSSTEYVNLRKSKKKSKNDEPKKEESDKEWKWLLVQSKILLIS